MDTKTPNPEKNDPLPNCAALQALTERLDQIEANLTSLREGLTAAASQPSPRPDKPFTLWLLYCWLSFVLSQPGYWVGQFISQVCVVSSCAGKQKAIRYL
jgi:hypothetical protein